MKTLSEMYTVAEVERHIDLICRDMPLFRQRVESGEFTPEESASDQKIIAVRAALARIETLKKEISDGMRYEDGELNPHLFT